MSNENFVIPNAAIDIGYFSTKTASKAGHQIAVMSFPSITSNVNAPQIVSAGMSALSGVTVKIDEMNYFVGPDAALQMKGRQSRTVTDKFVSTNEYKAFFKGALHYILRDYKDFISGASIVVIKRLVLGLPLNTYDAMRDELRRCFEGDHKVPNIDGKEIVVRVKSITVIPQPQGAMINSGAKLPPNQMKDYYSQNLLIIDLGGGTCDWLLSNDRKVVSSRSGAYQKGVLACVFAICEAINKEYATDAMVIQRIDEALRNGRESFKLGGVEYKTSAYITHANQVLVECLNQVLSSVGSLVSVDHIIFTGGGGRLLHEAALGVWKDHKNVMTVDPEPVFSNVYGFYHLGAILNG